MVFTVFLLLLLGVLVSVIATKLLIQYSLRAVPNSRSAHQELMPTAGGFAIALSISAGTLWLAYRFGLSTSKLPILLGLSSVALILGYLDDAYEIPAKIKFAAIGALSLAMAWALGPVMNIPFDDMQWQLPWILAMLGTALWCFTLINTVNFMDGADGAISLSALVAALILAVFGAIFSVWVVFWSALLLAISLIGFLPFNSPKAQIFLGDTGSLFIGCWLAGTALLLIASGPPAALWLMPMLFMPWLSDVLLTMAWRLLKKQDLLSPHNDHLYQWRMRSGKTHIWVALRLALQIAVVGLLALLFRNSPTSAFLGFAASASFALLVHWRMRQNASRQ